MKREVSIYIDLLRIVAAFAVLGEHASDYVGGWIWHFGAFGAEAVAVFFVLSGIVIAYVTSERERTAPSYAMARAVRLYSVIVPMMVVTWILDSIGERFNPPAYQTGLNVPDSLLNYLQCLTFTHALWDNLSHFGTNGPYWSLGFEAVYYFVFGCFLFVNVRQQHYRWAIALGLALAAGPRVAMYFPLWLLGVAVYRILARDHHRDPAEQSPVLLWAGVFAVTLLLMGLLHQWGHEVNRYLKIYRPFRLDAPYFTAVGYFYALGLLLAANIIALSKISSSINAVVARVARPIKWLAGGTFTLYLANLPLLLCLNAVMPPLSSPALRTTSIIAAAVAASYLLAELFERRKQVWARLFSGTASIFTSLRRAAAR